MGLIIGTGARHNGSGPARYIKDAEVRDGVLRLTMNDGSVVEFSAGAHPYLSLERLRHYLYRVTFDSLPEDNGGDNPIPGGCSAFVQDGKLYRNLDFKYDEAASFIVRTKDFEGMSFITGLDDGAMTDDLIAQLPYRVVDGRNSHGIMVSTHVLFNDWEWTGAGNKDISLTRLPFEVLTRVKSMATIATDLDGILGNLYASEGLQAMEYLLQVLVTDGTTTYAILPPTSEGEAFVLQDITSNPKLTNFRWLAQEEVSRFDMDMQDRPTGIERFNLMPCELSELRFTKAYETTGRLSEYIGLRDTTKASTDAELEAIYDDARAIYLDRERDGQTWQTMHSVVYGDGMENLWIQEDWNDDAAGKPDYPTGGTAGQVLTKTEDGVEWADAAGGGGLEQYATLADFPATGNVAISYLAKDTKGLYYWDAATSTYITMANKIYPVPGPDTANGIYIKYTDGTISPYDTLVEGKTPVGVALINNDENVKLVMHPKVGTALWQSPNGTISGTFNSDSKHNTDLILAARNTYSVPAAIWAREGAIWADGSEGQLPSMDVMEMFLANATQVNVAMGLIGGSTIQRSSNYWSSNQNSNNGAWYWYASSQSWRSDAKSNSYSVRSVCAF